MEARRGADRLPSSLPSRHSIDDSNAQHLIRSASEGFAVEIVPAGKAEGEKALHPFSRPLRATRQDPQFASAGLPVRLEFEGVRSSDPDTPGGKQLRGLERGMTDRSVNVPVEGDSRSNQAALKAARPV